MNGVNLLDGFQLDNDTALAVNGFQQSGTKSAVYFNRAANNPITYQFDILRLNV
jgi:hypothetical protein